MSNERLTIDDPRLTAYVLDELQEPQRAQFEAELVQSPQLQAALDELRQAAAQVFAALQTEPDIALTEEQLERIRTAAYSVPKDRVPAEPARVAVIGSRGPSSSSPVVASSAIVLAGLVLVTVAMVLSAQFPQHRLANVETPGLSELALSDDLASSELENLAFVAHSLSRSPLEDVTEFAEVDATSESEPTTTTAGLTLAYDELRGAYRMEIPEDGVVSITYVGLVSTRGLDGRSSGASSGESGASPGQFEENFEPQELSQLNEAEVALYDLFGTLAIDSEVELDLDNALGVSDTNRNGRLDDDRLWLRSYDKYFMATAAEPSSDDLPEWMVTGNDNVDAVSPQSGSETLTAVQADTSGVVEGVDQEWEFFVIPLQPLLAQHDLVSQQRTLLRNLGISTDGIDPTSTRFRYTDPSGDDGILPPAHYFYFETPTTSEMGGSSSPAQGRYGVDADGQPPEGMPAADYLRDSVSVEALRRLSERGSRSRSETSSTASHGVLTDDIDGGLLLELEGTQPMAESRGGAEQVPPVAADELRQLLISTERSAQDRVERITSGTTSELFRENRSEGEALPGQSRERLGEAVRRYDASVAERDAEIRRWQEDYRELQAEKEQLNEEYQRQLETLLTGSQFWERSASGSEQQVELDFVGREQWPGRTVNGLLPGDGFGLASTPGTESYASIVENDFLATLAEPVSTFSIDVDTGAYSNCRRFIENDMWPPADAVRVEELVNSFTYNDPPPADEHPVSVNFDVAACPWQPEHRLVRIGIRAADIIRAERPPTRLVFLIDVSGSMSAENKLPLVRQSLHLLVDELGEGDRVAIVTYANDASLKLESTSGDDHETILAAVDALNSGGDTNGEGGLRTAYDVAESQFLEGASNRVILCSDGDFNVGESEDSELVKLIEQKRETGVFLNVYGFGIGNLEDAKLEQIANHGNGQYGYVDSLDEARNIFVHDLTGTLYTVAKDVKLQVDFNPTQVESYRLIGYENRTLENADFDNDVVDAGDVGAGHSVTALYQIAPRTLSEETDPVELTQASLDRFVRFSENVDNNVRLAREGTVLNIDGTVVSEELKQETADFFTARLASPEFEEVEVRNNLQVVAAGELPPVGNDLLKLRVRYKQPDADESRLFEAVLVDDGTMQSPSADFQWSSAVASYGLLLRQSPFRGDVTFDAIIETAQAAVGDDPHGERREFIDLALRSQALYARQTGHTVPEPVELTSVAARERAACDDKYSNLLDKLEIPEDVDAYGAFRDYGYWEGDSYHTFTGLPDGYWVYVYPHWYIWGEAAE